MAPFNPDGKRILDTGTGTGKWPIEMGTDAGIFNPQLLFFFFFLSQVPRAANSCVVLQGIYIPQQNW